MRFTKHNGLAKVKTQVLLTLMVMNLKKLAKLIGKIPDKTRDFLAKLFTFPLEINFADQF